MKDKAKKTFSSAEIVVRGKDNLELGAQLNTAAATLQDLFAGIRQALERYDHGRN